jgi:hypothetical protein
MHVTYKIRTYASSELTVLKVIQKKGINLLCEGKKNTTHIKHSGMHAGELFAVIEHAMQFG